MSTENPEDAQKVVKAEFERLSGELKKFAEDAQKEIKAHGELSVELKAKVDEALVKQTEVQSRLLEIEQKLVRGNGKEERELAKTPGQILVESEAVQQFIKNKTRGTVSVEVKAAGVSTDIAADIIRDDRLPGILSLLRDRIFVRDLISPGKTSAPAVSYVRQTGFTNLADVVSEAVRKPQSDLTFDLKLAQVTTIAHFFKAAKQLLDDMPALQSTVDDELRYGLKFAEEQEILFGDGTGIHLNGIVPQATVFAPAFSVSNQTAIDDLRLALLQSELAFLPATGIVLHPTNWAQIELTKTTEGAYIWANPASMVGPTLWGKPVVATQVMDVNQFVVGAFKLGAQIFDREEANVQIATQNEADFVENLITIRAEERLALAVKRPEAFVTGDLTPAASA